MLSPGPPGFNNRPSTPSGTEHDGASTPGKLALFFPGEKPGRIAITHSPSSSCTHFAPLEIGFVLHNQVSLGVAFL
jgi:hypothetical protein